MTDPPAPLPLPSVDRTIDLLFRLIAAIREDQRSYRNLLLSAAGVSFLVPLGVLGVRDIENLQHRLVLLGVVKASWCFIASWLVGLILLLIGIRQLVPNLWRGIHAASVNRERQAEDLLVRGNGPGAVERLQEVLSAEKDALYAMRSARPRVFLALLCFYLAVLFALLARLVPEHFPV